jgi:hypothetical protein
MAVGTLDRRFLDGGAAFLRTLILALAILATAGLSLAETITTSLSSGADTFNLAAGSANNPAAASITATTAWALAPPYNLYVYGYFLNSTAALTDGAGHNIPSSAFYISVNGGNPVDRLLRRREPDTHDRLLGKRGETLQ